MGAAMAATTGYQIGSEINRPKKVDHELYDADGHGVRCRHLLMMTICQIASTLSQPDDGDTNRPSYLGGFHCGAGQV
jgi:hypothetical protein